MTSKRYTMAEAYQVTAQGTQHIEAFLGRKVTTQALRNVEDDPDYRAQDIDLLWTRQQPIETFISQVLDHVGAILYTDPQTGYFEIKLVRGDYSAASLPVLGPDVPLHFSAFHPDHKMPDVPATPAATLVRQIGDHGLAEIVDRIVASGMRVMISGWARHETTPRWRCGRSAFNVPWPPSLKRTCVSISYLPRFGYLVTLPNHWPTELKSE